MEILKIVEALQSYTEDMVAYKLDGGFANAVTEAVSLLISQGEQIADLQNELRHERWIEAEDGDGAVCSGCGEDFCNVYLEVERFLYCPNCGAKMR